MTAALTGGLCAGGKVSTSSAHYRGHLPLPGEGFRYRWLPPGGKLSPAGGLMRGNLPPRTNPRKSGYPGKAIPIQPAGFVQAGKSRPHPPPTGGTFPSQGKASGTVGFPPWGEAAAQRLMRGNLPPRTNPRKSGYPGKAKSPRRIPAAGAFSIRAFRRRCARCGPAGPVRETSLCGAQNGVRSKG